MANQQEFDFNCSVVTLEDCRNVMIGKNRDRKKERGRESQGNLCKQRNLKMMMMMMRIYIYIYIYKTGKRQRPAESILSSRRLVKNTR